MRNLQDPEVALALSPVISHSCKAILKGAVWVSDSLPHLASMKC